MKKITLVGRSALIAAVVAVVVIPAIATAGPGTGGTRGAASTPATTPPAAAGQQPGQAKASAKPAARPATPQGQPASALARRIENVLAARARRFDAASKAISAHIARVSALADKAEAAGIDVAKTRASLSAATAALAEANSLEQAAIQKFKAIPGSTGKRSAFAEARASGAQAVAQLKVARSEVVNAVHALRAAVKASRAEAETSESP